MTQLSDEVVSQICIQIPDRMGPKNEALFGLFAD
jgi:hypothetical protein